MIKLFKKQSIKQEETYKTKGLSKKQIEYLVMYLNKKETLIQELKKYENNELLSVRTDSESYSYSPSLIIQKEFYFEMIQKQLEYTNKKIKELELGNDKL